VDKYKQLAERIGGGAFSNELKRALTHKSFYKNEKSGNAGSRYIFLGQFAFRGLVADVLYKYTAMEGTQLQHLLGNMFKNEHLEKIGLRYDLFRLFRCGENFTADKHKHLAVFALLGFIAAHADENAKNFFIRKNFILANEHLFNQTRKRNDLLAQCNVLANMAFGKTVAVAMQKNGELWTTTVSVKETILSEKSSVSYQYSKKKSLKFALIALSEELNRQDEQTPDYAEKKQKVATIEKQNIETKKLKKQELYLAKQAKKKAERDEKREKLKAEKQQADLKRRQVQAAAKLRKEEQARKAEKRAAQLAKPMNAGKRRFLEDKKK
jgi:hypothetical protein